MDRCRRLTVLVSCALLATCAEDPAPTEPECVEEVKVVEVVSTDYLRDQLRALVDTMKANGWTCVDEPVRNAWGIWIGTRYTCTICR